MLSSMNLYKTLINRNKIIIITKMSTETATGTRQNNTEHEKKI